MDLVDRVKLKNSQLVSREIALQACLQNNSGYESKHASFLIFVLAPFGIGFIAQRFASVNLSPGAQFIRILFPLISAFSKL